MSFNIQPYSTCSAARTDDAEGDTAGLRPFLGVEAVTDLIMATSEAVLEAMSMGQGSFRALIISIISAVLAAVLALEL